MAIAPAQQRAPAFGEGVEQFAEKAGGSFRLHENVYRSGSGMNSVSPGTGVKRPVFQSCFACSMRSFDEETKFHQMCRGPSSAVPPRNIMRQLLTARTVI